MKKTIVLQNRVKVLLSYALICTMLMNVSYAQDKEKVAKKTITLGAQNQKATYGGLTDLREGNVYYLKDGSSNQKSIDLVYGFGTTTTANLMVPSSVGLKFFGALYKEQIFEKWQDKNRGSLVVLPNNKETKNIYKKIKTNQDLVNAFNNAVKSVSARNDYVKANHGPSARVSKLEIGDYVLIKSTDRNLYAMGQIVDIETGFQGSIRIDFKITK